MLLSGSTYILSVTSLVTLQQPYYSLCDLACLDKAMYVYNSTFIQQVTDVGVPGQVILSFVSQHLKIILWFHLLQFYRVKRVSQNMESLILDSSNNWNINRPKRGVCLIDEMENSGIDKLFRIQVEAQALLNLAMLHERAGKWNKVCKLSSIYTLYFNGIIHRL